MASRTGSSGARRRAGKACSLRFRGCSKRSARWVMFRQRLFANPILSLVSLIGLPILGYSAVGFVLDILTSQRAEQLRLSLPDALDLMVVCSEGGSALDQAMLKVSQELKAVHPALAEEFAIVNFEML